MGRKEVESNAPGDFSVETDKCMVMGLCLTAGSRNLGARESDLKKYINRQPKDEAEKTALMYALNLCPFSVIMYKGSVAHPETKIYAAKKLRSMPRIVPSNQKPGRKKI